MSTENTPDPNAQTEKPAAGNPEPKGPDGYAAAFKALQADNASLQAELKAREKKLTELASERDGFKAQVEQFGRSQREAKLVARLRDELPGTNDLMLRGMLATLHEGGEVDRFAPDDKLEETVKTAVEKIKPALMRPPAQGGGPGGGPPANNGRKQAKSLI